MKRLLYGICFLLWILPCYSVVKVKITSGINNPTLQKRMEKNASLLLTALKTAYENEKVELDLSGIECIEQESFEDEMQRLWDNSYVYPDRDNISAICIKTAEGFQLRDFSVELKPHGTNAPDESSLKSGIICFTKEGLTEYFYFSDDLHANREVLKYGEIANEDIVRRLQIEEFVNRFRLAYEKKDLEYIDQTFSDDALIITGKVIKRANVQSVIRPEDVTYIKHNKTQYLEHLRIVFRKNEWIKVNFSDIVIKRHPSKDYADFYGVTLKQNWWSSTYSDEGTLFMLWDFRNDTLPVVHVRTWQPLGINPFDLGDFDLENATTDEPNQTTEE